MKRFGLLLSCCLLVLPAWAESPNDPLSWLGRIASAGQRLTYTGTFTYQNGQRSETSRVVHLRDSNGEFERLEVLDGSPREVIRSNNEVRCVLPSQKTIIIDQPGDRRAFPSRLVDAWTNLSENYKVRRGDTDRVAGLEAQQIILEPRDDLRYGYRLWADVQSGLLLKSRMVDERGETIEQFAFNDVKIGGDISRDQLQPRYTGDQLGWQVVNTRANELRNTETGWALKAALPGFYQTSSVRRQIGHGEAVHMVFTDGLAVVSIFIEPLTSGGTKSPPGVHRSGSVNIFKRAVGEYMVTALGEVPPRTAQRLADAIEPVSHR